MLKSINKYLNESILLSILFGVIGIILIIWPETSLDTFAYIIGGSLIVYGTYNFIDSFTINPIFGLSQMITSILSFIFGASIFFNTSIFESLIPIVLGMFFIINGSFKARMSFVLKKIDNSWVLSLVTSIIMIICGIILILNPISTAIMITSIIGIILLVYGISDIIDMFIIKSRIKDFTKCFEKIFK